MLVIELLVIVIDWKSTVTDKIALSINSSLCYYWAQLGYIVIKSLFTCSAFLWPEQNCASQIEIVIASNLPLGSAHHALLQPPLRHNLSAKQKIFFLQWKAGIVSSLRKGHYARQGQYKFLDTNSAMC